MSMIALAFARLRVRKGTQADIDTCRRAHVTLPYEPVTEAHLTTLRRDAAWFVGELRRHHPDLGDIDAGRAMGEQRPDLAEVFYASLFSGPEAPAPSRGRRRDVEASYRAALTEARTRTARRVLNLSDEADIAVRTG